MNIFMTNLRLSSVLPSAIEPDTFWYYLLIFLGSVLIGTIIHFIALRFIKRFADKSDFDFDKSDIRKIRTPVYMFIVTGSALFSVSLASTETGPIVSFEKFLTILFIISIAWLTIQLIKSFRVVLLKQYDISVKDNLRARKAYTQFRILERIMVFVIVLISFAVALMTFEQIRKIGISLFASAGIAGIILGLAAQKAIATILAGFQLAITQPIRVEDVVIVEGEWGWIEEINLTYVVVRIWDKRRLVLPTTYFIEKPFQNWTRTSAEILGTVFLYTDYTIPVDEIREELTRLLNSTEHWDRQVNVLQVTNATERTMELRALMSAVDSPTAWNLRVYIREGLIKFLQERFPDSLPKTRVLLDKDMNAEAQDTQNE